MHNQHRINFGHPNGLYAVHPEKGQPKEEYYKNRPADNVSFRGSIVSSASKNIIGATAKEAAEPAKEWAKKLIQTEGFKTLYKFTDKYPGIFSAAVALGLAGLLKPISVMIMPGAEDEDKQQIATKNFVAALIGFAISSLAFKPFTDGVTKVVDNPEKYIPKDSKIVRKLSDKYGDYADAFKSLWDNGLEIIIAPVKAAMTIAIMPSITKALFGKKNERKKAEKLQHEYSHILPAGIQLKNNEGHAYKDFLKGGIV